MAGMTALQATLKKFEAEAAKMAAMKKDIAASRAGKPPPAKRAKKAGAAGGEVATARSAKPAVKAPIGKSIKDVIDHLRASGQPQAPAAIGEALGLDLSDGSALLAALRENDKIRVLPDDQLEFKAAYEAKTRKELLGVLAKHPEGVREGELQDAYPGAAKDLEAAQREGLLYRLYNIEFDQAKAGREGWFLFPSEPKLNVSLDKELIELWRKTALPADPVELDAELRRAGLEPMGKRRERKKVAALPKQKKKRKAPALRKVTNEHMPELFAGEAPTQID